MELGESQLLLMKMIVGHGIDIEELASIQNAVEKREGFAQRVLTDKEMERFASLKGRRQVEYLAGRWSATMLLGLVLWKTKSTALWLQELMHQSE